jgi:hypothetical protein
MEQPARIAHPVRLDDLIEAIKVVHTEAQRDRRRPERCPTWC